MSATKIEWCHDSVNYIVGCSKCSPGCHNCYAEKRAFLLSKNPLTAKKYAGVVDRDGKWTGKINRSWHWDDRDMPHRVPGWNKRVFVGSMTDLFHPNVSQDCLDEIFASILADAIVSNGHGHKYIVVTKRVDRMLNYFAPGPGVLLRRWGKAGNGWIHIGDGDETFAEYAEGHTIPQPGHETYPHLLHEYLWPLPNLWLMATICNQHEANEKIPLLLQVPAVVRGVSIEPMLGPVDLTAIDWTPVIASTATKNALTGEVYIAGNCGESSRTLQGAKLHWVISGAETGSHARPYHPAWFRSVCGQCQEASVPYFHKSNGEWRESTRQESDTFLTYQTLTEKGRPQMHCAHYMNKFERVPVKPGSSSSCLMRRVGKKMSGRFIDGHEWNQVPA